MKNNSDELIPTRGSLLSRLKDWRDQESWQDFFNTYWKLIYGAAIRAGLSDVEAQEVVQETVISVAKAIPEFKYNSAACSFKTWLQVVTRRRIADQFRKRRPQSASAHWEADDLDRTATVDAIADPASLDWGAVWEEEWQRNLVEVAIECGLIHRDIKPSNIIFVNGAPKLADIGLVTDLDASLSFVGTEGFIPPEGPGTAQADLYSLGKVSMK